MARKVGYLIVLCLFGLVRAAPAQQAQPAANGTALAQLGRRLFFDTSLSASGKLACATCHDPRYAYGPSNGQPSQLGGPGLNLQGLRAVPSLRYVLSRTPRWSAPFHADPLESLTDTDSAPSGGFARDGRFDTLHEQARTPFLAANEMANPSVASIVAKIGKATYVNQFKRLFGSNILQKPQQAFARTLEALERFQLDDSSFHPYTSKFDRYLQGKGTLSAAEQRGLQLFTDPGKGNCAACHSATPGADGSPPLFTDFSFAALGVPRNSRLAANANPRFYDLGMCGPLRSDQAITSRYCGMFKTPTLRNVAARKIFMHNGVFTDLADVVRFYASRDSLAAAWYPRKADGSINRYNDLPQAFRGNVDVADAPFNRSAGAPPALSQVEVGDIVAFLHTLTDADINMCTPVRTHLQVSPVSGRSGFD